MFKKTNIIFIFLIICLFFSGCSLSKTLNEDIVLNIIEKRLKEDIPNSYNKDIFNGLKISNDKDNKYSKELISYILENATISVYDIQDNVVTFRIKTRDFYSYLDGNKFLTEFILSSNKFSKTCLSYDEYNKEVLNFFIQKIDSNDIKYETLKVDIKFNFNEETSKWEISDESYFKILDTILCKDTEKAKKITKKLEPLGYAELKFSNNETTQVVEKESNIDKPRKKDYDSKNEQSLKDNIYVIPDDTEYKDIPLDNDTTRTSRRSPIKIGQTSVFDGNKLQNPNINYKVNILINNCIYGKEALAFLKESKEDITDDTNYIVFSVTIKLVENNTDLEEINFNFTDFDLIDYEGNSCTYFTTKNLKEFDTLKEKDTTTGHIVFEYETIDTLNLAFREYLPNTIWFSLD